MGMCVMLGFSGMAAASARRVSQKASKSAGRLVLVPYWAAGLRAGGIRQNLSFPPMNPNRRGVRKNARPLSAATSRGGQGNRASFRTPLRRNGELQADEQGRAQ